jgi:VWFA-related protein
MIGCPVQSMSERRFNLSEAARTIWLGVIWLCSAGLLESGLSAGAPPWQSPPPANTKAGPRSEVQVFRASAALIRLDVLVTDSQGLPVTDLTATDFAVFQDGKRQSLQFVEFRPGSWQSAPRPGPSKAATLSPGEPQRARNDGPEAIGRRLLFLVDDFHMEFDSVARVREALSKIAADGLLPDDQVLIMGTRDRNGPLPSFTNDRELIRREILALRAEPRGRNQAFDAAMALLVCRDMPDDLLDPGLTEGPLAVLASALVSLREYPGRKAVLLLADSVGESCREVRWSLYERLRRLSDLAARSSAIIYGLQTRQLSSGVRMPEQSARPGEVAGPVSVKPPDNLVNPPLRRLAEATGGFARRSNSVRELVETALADRAGYYALGYEPPRGTFADGTLRYRTLKVRVNRKESVVRTRGGFYSVDDAMLVRP